MRQQLHHHVDRSPATTFNLVYPRTYSAFKKNMNSSKPKVYGGDLNGCSVIVIKHNSQIRCIVANSVKEIHESS